MQQQWLSVWHEECHQTFYYWFDLHGPPPVVAGTAAVDTESSGAALVKVEMHSLVHLIGTCFVAVGNWKARRMTGSMIAAVVRNAASVVAPRYEVIRQN